MTDPFYGPDEWHTKVLEHQKAEGRLYEERREVERSLELEGQRRQIDDLKKYGESLIGNPRARWEGGGRNPYIIPTEQEVKEKSVREADRAKTARTQSRVDGWVKSVFSAGGVAIIVAVIVNVIGPMIGAWLS